MPIPMTDLKAQYASIKDEVAAAIQQVIESGRFILGPEVEAFEKEMAAYCGAKFAIGVASGTDAIILSLIACGVKPGDEVITTPFTFIATAEAITQCGASPVFVDIDKRTYNIDPAQIELLFEFNQVFENFPLAFLEKARINPDGLQHALAIERDSHQARTSGSRGGHSFDRGLHLFHLGLHVVLFYQGIDHRSFIRTSWVIP